MRLLQTSQELIEYMKSKGIKFSFISKENAKAFLEKIIIMA